MNPWRHLRPVRLAGAMALLALLAAATMLGGGCAANHTHGQPRVCEVHHVRMARKTVPIRYGYPGLSRQDLQRLGAAPEAFPHAEREVRGPCFRPLLPARRAVIRTCPDCEMARRQWEAAYEAAP